MLAVNRDIMIRTASPIAAFLFFTAQGARAGDLTLAANAVLNNVLLISAFFLDGLATVRRAALRSRYGALYATRLPARAAGGVPEFGFAMAVAVYSQCSAGR